MSTKLQLGVELKKGVQGGEQLIPNFGFARTLDQVHRHRRLAPVLQMHFGFIERLELIGRQQSASIYQRKFGHQD